MKKLSNLNLAQVRQFAKDLANEYSKKDCVIGLVGPLGAGKTEFTKSFAKVLGIKHIKSPTFIIFSVYPYRKKLFYHFDFYRLQQEKQLQALGVSEILHSPDRIVLIEWADKFPKILKQCDLVIDIKIVNQKFRDITIK